MKAKIFYFILLGQVVNAAPLKKHDVIELLKNNAYRWQQTEIQKLDAEAKLQQADSAFSPFLNLTSRQVVAKINPLQLGLESTDNLNWLAVGSVGFQTGLALWDSASRTRIDAAKANLKIQSYNEKQYKNELTFLALMQFLNLQKMKKHRQVIGENLERDLKILNAAKKKLSSGFGISLDVERALGLVELQNFKQLDAETNSTKACQELASTLAKTDLNCDVDNLIVSVISDERLEEEGRKFLFERFDLKAAESTVTAAESLLAQAKNENWPKLVMFGDMAYVGTSVVNGFEKPVTGMAGLQLTMPLYSGGLHAGRIQEQSAKVSAASQQQRQLLVEAQNQLKVAVAQLKSAKSALVLSERQIDIATKELVIAQKKSNAGSVSSLELNTAQMNLTNANELKVQVQFAYEAAKLNYFRTIGRSDGWN